MSSQMARAHLYIRGRVQGVFFRRSMCDEARRLGARGWVRNCADGSVEAVVEGAQSAVDRLIIWAHEGPPGALVTEVTADWEPERGEFSDFTTRH